MSRGLRAGTAFRTLAFSSRTDFAVVADRRLHRQVGQDLEHVVFDHVADRAGLLVKVTAALDAEVLGHRDLHTFDVAAVPDRFEKRVLKAEILEIPHGRFAQVVVDAEDRPLAETWLSRILLRDLADSRSRPNGFSTITRPFSAQPDLPSCSTTMPNMSGGMAR